MANEANQNQREAFHVLYGEHADEVFRYLTARTDPATAQDLLHGVFLVAWNRRRLLIEIEPHERIRWLIVVARNLHREHERGARREQRALDRIHLDSSSPPSDDEAVSRVDATVVVADLWGHLSAAEKELVEALVANDGSHILAARTLEVPVGTVSSRRSRLRKRLGHGSAANRGREGVR